MKDNLAQLKRIIKEEHQKLLQEQGSSLTKLGTGGKALQIWKPPFRNPVNIPISGLGAAGALSGLQYAPLATLTKQPLATNIGTGAKFSELDLPKRAAKDLPPEVHPSLSDKEYFYPEGYEDIGIDRGRPEEVVRRVTSPEGHDFFFRPETSAPIIGSSDYRTPRVERWEADPVKMTHKAGMPEFRRVPEIVRRSEEAQVNNFKNRLARSYASGLNKDAWLQRGVSEEEYKTKLFPRIMEKINDAKIEFRQPWEGPPEAAASIEEWSTSSGLYSPRDNTIYMNSAIQEPQTLPHEYAGHAISVDTGLASGMGYLRQQHAPRSSIERMAAIDAVLTTLKQHPEAKAAIANARSPADIAQLQHDLQRQAWWIVEHGHTGVPGDPIPLGKEYFHPAANLGTAQAEELYSLLDTTGQGDTIGRHQGYKWAHNANAQNPNLAPATWAHKEAAIKTLNQAEEYYGRTLSSEERLATILSAGGKDALVHQVNYVRRVEEIRANLMAVRDQLKRKLEAQDIIDACKGVSSHGADAINSVPAFRDFLKCGTPEKTAETFNKIVKVIHRNQIHLDRPGPGQRPQTRMVTESKIKHIIKEEYQKLLQEQISGLTKLGPTGKAIQIWRPPFRNPVNIPISGLGAAGALSGLQYAPLASLTRQPLATNIGTGAKFSELAAMEQEIAKLAAKQERSLPGPMAKAREIDQRFAYRSPIGRTQVNRITEPIGTTEAEELAQQSLPSEHGLGPVEYDPIAPIDPDLKIKYFGPEPDVAYRRVPPEQRILMLPDPNRTSAPVAQPHFGPTGTELEPQALVRHGAGPTGTELESVGKALARAPVVHPNEFKYTPDPAVHTTHIAQGAYRTVYEVPGMPDVVLKIARTGPVGAPAVSSRAGVNYSTLTRKMNKFEALPEYQRSPYALKVFDAAPDFSWILQEKANEFSSWRDMFEFFPNFKKEMNIIAQKPMGHQVSQIPGGGYHNMSKKMWANDVGPLFGRIMALNEPMSKSIIMKDINYFKKLEPQMSVLERVKFWEDRPETFLFNRAKEIFNRWPGRYSDEQLIDLLNSLITDPQVSAIRDFSRSTNILKPAAETRDFKFSNMGYTISPDGKQQLKIIDSGYGITPLQ